MRKKPTDAERKLWALLRDRRFVDYKFRRQATIGRYIADFACHDAKLIIELDGSGHAENPRDVVRDAEIKRLGYRTLRIWNTDLFLNPQPTLEAIWNTLEETVL